jgi:hypothetical protein
MNPFARAMGAGSAIEAGQTIVRGLADPFNLFGFKGKTTGEQEAEKEKKNLDTLAATQAMRAEQQRRDEEDLNKIVAERSAIQMQNAQAERDALSHKMAGMTIEERRTEILKQIADTEKKHGADCRPTSQTASSTGKSKAGRRA